MSFTGEPRRVLYVSPFDEPLSGADESLALALSKLDRRRYDPVVLVQRGSQYAERYKDAGAEVFSRPVSRLRRAYGPSGVFKYLAELRAELRSLPLFLRERKVDLVHVNMHVCLGPLVAANRAGIPVVVHYRAKTNDRPRLFFDAYLPWLHRRSAAIICISEAVASHFRRRGLQRGVEVVPNPVSLDRYARAGHANPYAGREPLGGKQIVLFVGRIHPQKRLHVLLDALELLSNRRSDLALVVVGESGSDAGDLSYASNLRLRTGNPGFPAPVAWEGKRSEVAPYMRFANVLVLPSVNEGFGRVLVEAMASGVPVVGASSGAIPEVLRGGEYGQLVAPDDPAELAAAVEIALNGEAARQAAARARKHVVETYSVEEHVRKLMGIYERVAG